MIEICYLFLSLSLCLAVDFMSFAEFICDISLISFKILAYNQKRFMQTPKWHAAATKIELWIWFNTDWTHFRRRRRAVVDCNRKTNKWIKRMEEKWSQVYCDKLVYQTKDGKQKNDIAKCVVWINDDVNLIEKETHISNWTAAYWAQANEMEAQRTREWERGTNGVKN